MPPVLPLSLAQLAQRYEQAGLDLYGQEPDISGLQGYARQRSQEGQGSMLNALAAQYAGPQFEPVQGMFLKRAMAAQEPMKVGNAGFLTPKGQFVKDPTYQNDRRAEVLLKQAQSLYGLDERQQRAAADRDTRMALGALRASSANAGGFGAGTSSQIGSTPTGAPIFRHSKQGYLFTYDENGQPAAYAGNVLPKASTAQPSEDERKAAGWFAQAENARRNMLAVADIDPSASNPTWQETYAEKVPWVGDAWANSLRPENRQMFVQAASSMAEALLRAATGAGVNEQEARQKVAELVPMLGDKPGTIRQKTNSYDVYMASLRARAGRALPQLEAALQEILKRQSQNAGAGGDDGVIDLPAPGSR